MGKKISTMFFLFFIVLSLGAATLQADTIGANAFWWEPGAITAQPLLAGQSGSKDSPTSWRSAGPNLGNGVLTILGGMVGNVVGMYAGAYLGLIVPTGPVWGMLAGSTLGSALGAYLAGSYGGHRGNFGAALGGSLLGELAAVGLAFAIHSEEAPFLAGFLILPPLGAALAFNSSRRSSPFRAGNGLLNLADGKLGLGVPDVQVRPSFVPGLKAKPELQFNVKVLSVEL